MQHIGLDGWDRPEFLDEEIARLERSRRLTPEQSGALNRTALRQFWCGNLGRQLCERSEHIERELPFTARFSCSELGELGLMPETADLANEWVVIQGAVDLAVLAPTEIWVVDFKTDEVTDRDVGPRAEQYAAQVRLYGLGLERIYRRPVTRLWLHFFSANRTVEMSAAAR